MSGIRLFTLFFCLSLTFSGSTSKEVLTVEEVKGWKKVLKSRSNVLALFASTSESVASLLPVLEEVAGEIRGRGSVVFVDCSAAKKVCKSLKLSIDRSTGYILKHYKDGSFHKNYDRLLQKSSLLDFLEDPTSEAPWSEDPTSKDVKHISSSTSFYKLLGRERKPILAMFYVPWCGHCQKLKPEFAGAATKLKGKAVLVGMNLDKPEAMLLREEYNITGYPTVLYFEGGKLVYDYLGERDEEAIINWMKNPQPPPEKESEPEKNTNWSTDLTNIVHLTQNDFQSFMLSNPSVLVAFYAPWCGHCKAMKPEYNKAAKIIQQESIQGVLAAVDATQEKELATLFQVSGYPSIKYFQNGEPAFDYGYPRTTEAFVDFMRNPRPPPEQEKDWSELDTQVHHLTDETFKSFTKKTKHLLVMFYAPWCGHCKAAKPHFIEAAESLKADRKIALAAVDCTKYENTCVPFDVQGYPTILYMSYGKKPSKYMGQRTSASFVDFLNDPAKYTPTVKDEF